MRVLTLSRGNAVSVERTLEELAAISVRYRFTKAVEIVLVCRRLLPAPESD
jgi:hypothetical protein